MKRTFLDIFRVYLQICKLSKFLFTILKKFLQYHLEAYKKVQQSVQSSVSQPMCLLFDGPLNLSTYCYNAKMYYFFLNQHQNKINLLILSQGEPNNVLSFAWWAAKNNHLKCWAAKLPMLRTTDIE